jgi:hypothetical protein
MFSRSWWGKALIVAGAVITLGSAVTGLLWLNRVPAIHPVPFSEEVQITASGSDEVSIFTPTGQATVPACEVTTQDARQVVLTEPQRYQQSAGLESSYGFTITSGTAYTVSCGEPGQGGQFAVAEVGEFPEAAFLAVGTLDCSCAREGLYLSGVDTAI